MKIFSVVMGNAVTIICFTLLSIHFNNPWLVLLAIFFYQSYSSKENQRKDTNENGND